MSADTRQPNMSPSTALPGSSSTWMRMARLSGARTLARKPRSRGRKTSCDVTGLPVSRKLRTREPRSPVLASGVSRIAPDGTLPDGAERTSKSSSRTNVPPGSGNAATQRSCGKQLNDARQREANRQSDEQLDIAAANPSPLVDDDQQQKQDSRAD